MPSFSKDRDVSIIPCVTICVGVIVAALLIALPIAELVLGTKYLNANQCNIDLLMMPTTWLLVDGITGIVSGVFLLCAMILFFIAPEIGIMTAMCCFLPLQMFSFAWAIVGAVMLWRDNLSCEPRQLHDILWASIIIHLIAIAQACLLPRRSSD